METSGVSDPLGIQQNSTAAASASIPLPYAGLSNKVGFWTPYPYLHPFLE